jgi:mercuric ion binding protein
MKKQLTMVLTFLFITMFSFAQTKDSTTIEKIKVWGNCDMCKTKIEKAAKSAGAATADWNEESKILNVTYSASKNNNKKIQLKVADAGYDTQDLRASDAAYNKLPGCCKYDRKPQL